MEILIQNTKNSIYEHVWVITIGKNQIKAFNVHCISHFGNNALKMEQMGQNRGPWVGKKRTSTFLREIFVLEARTFPSGYVPNRNYHLELFNVAYALVLRI